MVEQPSNKQVEQRKETSATARRRSPPAPRLPSPSSTPATCTVALELVSEALDGLRNHARAGRTGCAQRPRRLDFAPGHTGPLRGQYEGASMPGDKPSHRPAPHIDGDHAKKPHLRLG